MFHTFDYEYNYWWGSFWQMLVMAAFLINIWRTKDCSGISLKSQILYALVFSTRQLDLQRYYVPPEHIVIKVLYLILTFGTALSIYKFCSKTYEKEKDTYRIHISIVSCIALSLIFNDRFDWLRILMAFSVYLEAVTMVPQFEMIYKAKCTKVNVFLYIICMAIYSFGQMVYLSSKHPDYRNSYRTVAITTQFLLYCDFFRRIYPLICPDETDETDENKVTSRFSFLIPLCNVYSFLRSKQTNDVEANVDNETPNTGHLANNFSSVVLTPATLDKDQYNKGFSLETGDAIKKEVF